MTLSLGHVVVACRCSAALSLGPRRYLHKSNSGISATSVLDFADHRNAFKHKTTWELLRALLVLRACSSDYLVDNGLQLMRLFGARSSSFLLRPTVYAQFVGGACPDELHAAAHTLRMRGLRLMVAPALEEDVHEATDSLEKYDANLRALLQLVAMTSRSGSAQPCLQCKMTALLSADVLMQLSTCVGKPTANHVSRLADAILSRDATHFLANLPSLTEPAKLQVAAAVARCATLGRAAQAEGVRLLVDAEWSYVNPACSLFALAMMTAFNQSEPLVANTYQCYFENALPDMIREISISTELGFCWAAKLVRGAYLEREKAVDAASTCDSHAATGRNYNRVFEAAVTHTAASRLPAFLIVATHNEAAVVHAVSHLRQTGVEPGDSRFAFAQIYGMAEHISLPLAGCGHSVYKSVPYGGLTQVLPYLSRRLAENRSVLQGARRERELLQSEIADRMRSACAIKRKTQ